MVEAGCYFDSFGHVDYIARYAPLVGDYFLPHRFEREIDSLLKVLVLRDIALEINTNRFGSNNGAEMLIFEICRRFVTLGGRFCTIGSDAHEIKHLGRHMKEAKKIAAEAGLTPVYYKERKPIPCG
jgi:histidinol-phosphatase (PHP family)